MWTAIPAVVTSVRGARLRDALFGCAQPERAPGSATANAGTAAAGTDGFATPDATIIWRAVL